MLPNRRSILSAIGIALPFAAARAGWAVTTAGPPPGLRFRSFEEAVRAAFAGIESGPGEGRPCRRVEVGYAPILHGGVQGCHNDRPFAGHPAGQLRIVRAEFEPGPVRGGVRLYVSTVEIARVNDADSNSLSRPLDFASLPPAPILCAAGSEEQPMV